MVVIVVCGRSGTSDWRERNEMKSEMGLRATGIRAGIESVGEENKSIYWHSELPPVDAEVVEEHSLEASSRRVPGTLAHRDELWTQSYEDLMAQTGVRLEQELARLGGRYARVLDEHVDSRHDPVLGEAWLHGAFTYMLYRSGRPRALAG